MTRQQRITHRGIGSNDPVDQEIRRILLALRTTLRSQRKTQLEVQERLGWGRSSISQLFTRQKRLRMDQILAILWAIDMPPEHFFADLYRLRLPHNATPPSRDQETSSSVDAHLGSR